jgi:hypothetical protein
MPRGQPSRPGTSRGRRKSPPRSIRVVLRPGQRLETSTVIVTARKRPQGGGGGGGAETTVTCECTAAEPDEPDCEPVSTKTPGGGTIRVRCNKTGGCRTCKQTTTTTSSGVVMA